MSAGSGETLSPRRGPGGSAPGPDGVAYHAWLVAGPATHRALLKPPPRAGRDPRENIAEREYSATCGRQLGQKHAAKGDSHAGPLGQRGSRHLIDRHGHLHLREHLRAAIAIPVRIVFWQRHQL
jgi:hypothetical protein